MVELVGSRQSPGSRAASHVDLELRPPGSTGVTRFHRYYGPLRHQQRPGLLLTEVLLRVTRSHRCGFPCFGRFPLVRMLASLPRQDGLDEIAHLIQLAAAFPVTQAGRLLHYPFRGLLSVHSRYGLRVC